MSKEREAELTDQLNSCRDMEVAKLFIELFTLRRERFRDKLERQEDPETRGRALECKDMLHVFS